MTTLLKMRDDGVTLTSKIAVTVMENSKSQSILSGRISHPLVLSDRTSTGSLKAAATTLTNDNRTRLQNTRFTLIFCYASPPDLFLSFSLSYIITSNWGPLCVGKQRHSQQNTTKPPTTRFCYASLADSFFSLLYDLLSGGALCRSISLRIFYICVFSSFLHALKCHNTVFKDH